MKHKNFPSIGSELCSLRKMQGLYQYDVAERLSIAQKNICVIEKRKDLQLSTLKKYIEAIGGNLKILVEFKESDFAYDLSQSIIT